jgi:hypothetical protein
MELINNPKPINNPGGAKRPTTHWDLTTRAKVLTLDKTGAYIEKSKALFARVIKDHPGTPYASRAEWELKRGFGVDLVEDHDEPDRGKGVVLPKL